MSHVDIRIEQEEIESLEIAVRALHGERQALSRHGLTSGELSVAIDDLDEILARVRFQQQQQEKLAVDPWSRRVPALQVVS